jgi:hypothetical protein
MGLIFILYVGFTLYLYFAREVIRAEVNYLFGSWYEQAQMLFRQAKRRTTRRRRQDRW